MIPNSGMQHKKYNILIINYNLYHNCEKQTNTGQIPTKTGFSKDLVRIMAAEYRGTKIRINFLLTSIRVADNYHDGEGSKF